MTVSGMVMDSIQVSYYVDPHTTHTALITLRYSIPLSLILSVEVKCKMEEYLLEYPSFGLDLTRESNKLKKEATNSLFDLFVI